MAKRTNGEGTIYQDKTGLWRGELTLGYENGKRIKKQFSSMDLDVLQKKINDEKFKLNRNMATQVSDFTVKTWLEFWMQTYKLNTIKPRTYDYYEYSLIHYAYNMIGNIKLDKIKSAQIQQLYNSLFARGLSTSSISGVHKPLNQAFEQAIYNELIYKNPCKGVKIPKREPRKSRAMTVGEQEIFIQACNGTTYHNLFIFLLNTGMRRGEALCLTWKDINFDEMLVIVNKSMSIVKNRDENAETKNLQIISSTKTESGERTIPINKICLSILQKQPKSNSFVFSSKVGTPLGERNVQRAFTELLKKTGLDESSGLTIHSLRHTFATRLLEKNANIKVVSELLGHKSIQITLDIYSHVQPSLKNQTIKLLD